MRKDLALIRSKVSESWNFKRDRRNFERIDWKSMFNSFFSHQKGIILAYHRVNRFSKAGFRPTKNLSVHTEDFEAHLKFFQQHCTIISLRMVVECVKSGKRLPERFVALTFDDGYEDNFTDAYPLLMKYSAPATFFLSAGLLDGTEPLWHDALEMVLSQSKRKSFILNDKDCQMEFPIKTAGEKWYAYEWLTKYILNLQSKRRAEFLFQLGELLGFNDLPVVGREQRLLRWDQVQEMQQSPLMEFGSHTMFHHQLTKLDEDEIAFELGESHRKIQEKTRQNDMLFSYPNGTSEDVSEIGIRHLQSNGYLAACTMERQLMPEDGNLFRIPRIGTGGLPIHGLMMRIASVFNQSPFATTGVS